MTTATVTFEDACAKVAATAASLIPWPYGWENDEAFLVLTNNAEIPESMRDQEEDALMYLVAKASGDIIDVGAFHMMLKHMNTMTKLGDWPPEDD